MIGAPQVQFIAPVNMTYVSAGTNTSVRLFSTNSGPFSVQLNCVILNVTPVVEQIAPNTPSNVPFFVPANFYGMSCNFTVINSPSCPPINFVTIVVTQAITFASPVRSSSYLVKSQIPVLLQSNVSSQINFTVTQNCNNTISNYNNVYLGITYQATLPSNYIGSCTYTAPANTYYRAASVAIKVVQGYVSFLQPVNGTTVKAGNKQM